MKKLFYKLTSWTLIYNICSMFKWSYLYIKDYGSVYDVLHGDAFARILRTYLRMNPRKDWLGRLYGIVNPNLKEDGTFDFNNVVFELDGVNTNTHSYVENWFYKQMLLVNNVFGMQHTGFFDMITADVEHVGPEDHDNYLVVFDIASRQMMCKQLKRVLKQSILYIMLGVGIYFVLK